MLRSALLALSRNQSLRHFSENSRLGRRASRRFVAGLNLADAIRAVRGVNQVGMSASLDPLGENVTSEAEARNAAEAACELLRTVHREGVDSNLSVKLTHLGLDLGHDLAVDNLRRIAALATELRSFVRVDMEGSDYTAATLDIVCKLHAEGLSIGTVLQAYLFRTDKDLTMLMQRGIRVRVVKGAYRESAAIAWQKKAEVDASYIRLASRAIETGAASGLYHAIATHDPAMIAATMDHARARGIDPNAFEFQMLYGIRRDLQQKLRREGWRVRVYIPFGPEWYPYFMRRLAERPANVLFLLKNLIH